MKYEKGEEEIQMEPEELITAAVRAVVIAMRDGVRQAFFDVFSDSAVLTD